MASNFLRPQFLFLDSDDVCKVDALSGCFSIRILTLNLFIFYNLKKFVYFKLEDNCFTVLHWFLPNNNMNQP